MNIGRVLFCVLMLGPFAARAAAGGDAPMQPEGGSRTSWLDELLAPRPPPAKPQHAPVVQLLRQDHEQLERGRSVIQTPMAIGQRRFAHGLGTHSVSHIRVCSPEPIEGLSAWIGVDSNDRTQGGKGSVTFTVSNRGEELYRSGILRGGEEPSKIAVETKGATELDLLVGDG
ncbi:MAG: NPCBM/NEW2 domain-containing protein, partial [Planctomycetota bacterium]|nr:NPCBM/NEW2 domain-containing protein [Planctomycetota bacterium]